MKLRIRELRTAAGITQEVAAGRAKIRQALWSQYERGARTPSLSRLSDIAAGLGCSPAELLETTKTGE
jgi:transcriptional regulator with XRE-family HTH domain